MGTLVSELGRELPNRAAPPRVYVDANMPAGIVSLMRRELRWDVLFVLEHDDLRRASDRDHFHHALDRGRTLITLDKDFLDDETFPASLSPSLIVCSAPDERWLARVMRYVDRSMLRTPDGARLPLRGQKRLVTSDALTTPGHGPAEAGRQQ